MKKSLLLLSANLIAVSLVFSQGTAINTSGTAADASAILDVSSTTRGLLIPRMTETDRVTIASPATGLMVYQTDVVKGFYYHNGTAWTYIGADNLGNHTATDSLNMSMNKIVNLATCTYNYDAANKIYVDNAVLAGGGGGASITMLSYPVYGGSTLSWIACADSCHNLDYQGYNDWRMPASDEVVYYRTRFDTPSGGWISGYIFCAGTLVPTDNRSTMPLYNESTGTYSAINSYTTYSNNRCRCVR